MSLRIALFTRDVTLTLSVLSVYHPLSDACMVQFKILVDFFLCVSSFLSLTHTYFQERSFPLARHIFKDQPSPSTHISSPIILHFLHHLRSAQAHTTHSGFLSYLYYCPHPLPCFSYLPSLPIISSLCLLSPPYATSSSHLHAISFNALIHKLQP